MRLEEKNIIIDNLTKKINEANHFYLADVSGLNALDTSTLRRKCFEKDINLVVVKNTLLKKALEKSDVEFDPLYDVLVGNTSIIFSETGNVPAKVIKEFRKKNKKPIIKAAYVEESFYFGDDQLETLANIKSKDELIGDIVLLLQSPLKNVMSSLNSGGNILTGVLKTLAEKK
ncbi:MAG: 50S ribosomal protein L10 [Bacteroidetes bacterium]|nr:MAG: 50S ribosomal protein L10 [Bacteroidota bacterium]